jgi:hypothetical protein
MEFAGGRSNLLVATPPRNLQLRQQIWSTARIFGVQPANFRLPPANLELQPATFKPRPADFEPNQRISKHGQQSLTVSQEIPGSASRFGVLPGNLELNQQIWSVTRKFQSCPVFFAMARSAARHRPKSLYLSRSAALSRANFVGRLRAAYSEPKSRRPVFFPCFWTAKRRLPCRRSYTAACTPTSGTNRPVSPKPST